MTGVSAAVLLTLQRDEAVMEAIRGAWDTFSLYLDGDNPPPLSEADSAQRDDPAWGEAAAAFVAAKRNADSADEALDSARQRLVDLDRYRGKGREEARVTMAK